MNKKYAISAIVLIALMSLSLIPLRASAYDSGPSVYPNTDYSMVGPQASSLVMLLYTDPTAEIQAYLSHSHQIDIMDGAIPPDYIATIQADPDHYIMTAALPAFSLYDYDMNDAVLPFNIATYRQGLTSLIDRSYLVDQQLTGAATVAYSPLACYGSTWSDTSLSSLFTGDGAMAPDFAKAYVWFCQALGPPVIDNTPIPSGAQSPYPSSGYWSTWMFTSPFPNKGPDNEPGVGDGHISIYARTTGADAYARTAQGTYLAQRAIVDMPDYFSYAGNLSRLEGPTGLLHAVFPDNYTLYYPPEQGGHMYLPRIDIDNYPEPRSNTAVWVMESYYFELYTGGWSLSTEPSGTITGWITAQDPAHKGNAPGVPNYESYENSLYDDAVTAYLTSANTVDAAIASKTAEDIMMGEAGIIPMWFDSGYWTTLSCERNVILQQGVGLGSWWTFLDGTPGTNAFITSPGYSSNSMFWGWSSDFQNLNIVTSQWVWDYYIMNEIYDGLVALNPYDVTNVIPYMASSYSFDASHSVYAHTIGYADLRTDIYWQNVPFMHREAFTPDNGPELNGPMQDILFTPLDYAFTAQYLRDQDHYTATWNGIAVDDVAYVEVSSVYNVSGSMAHQMSLAAQGLDWPWWNATAFPNGPAWENVTWINDPNGANYTQNGTVPPFVYQYDFVHFNPALNAHEIKVYLNDDLTWLIYYRAFGTYVLPMHIFMWLPTGSWANRAGGAHFTTQAVGGIKLESPSIVAGGADLLYGTGPYILASGVAAQSYTMIANIPGASWVGGGGVPMTETHGYFNTNIGASPVTAPDTAVSVDYTDTGLVFNTTLVNSGAPTNINYHWLYSVYQLDPTTGLYTIPSESGTTTPVIGHSVPTGTSYVSDSVHISETFGDQITASVAFVFTVAGVTYEGVIPAQYFNLGATSHGSEVGITGYKLVFHDALVNSYSSALSIDYHWSYDVVKYNATSDEYDIPVVSGVTSTVSGYSVPTTGASVLDQAVLPTSLAWGDKIEVTSNFVYVENGTTHTATVAVTDLKVHPADMAGAAVTFPYLGADGKVAGADLNNLGLNWGVNPIPPGTSPTSALARADINGDNKVAGADLNILGLEWGLTWS